jgi:hypothetical protein
MSRTVGLTDRGVPSRGMEYADEGFFQGVIERRDSSNRSKNGMTENLSRKDQGRDDKRDVCGRRRHDFGR